ncbi:MAG: hypothetical protein EOM62_20910 [Bacteroidia bacterium]|nr:hypothetical protein [Bacteroidia bacterium]
MKKSATYYFLLITCANAWLMWFFPQFTRLMMRQWEIDLQGQPLPSFTSLLVRFPLWPVVFLVVSSIGLATAIILKNRNKELLHAVIALLLAESFTLFCVGIGHAIPYVRILSPLK